MKLQIESIKINDITFGDKTEVVNGVLFINKEELENHLANDNFKSISIELAKPGESKRIVNVVDVIEPRCKVEDENDFPGVLAKITPAGKGATRALKGVAVAACDRHQHWIHSKSLIDMAGPGAELGRYGKMPVVVFDAIPNDNVTDLGYAHAVKVAGLKTAVYLAKASLSVKADVVDVFDSDPDKVDPDLPRVAYYYQVYSPQHDPKGNPDPIFYGYPISTTLPLVVNPNEILDGAILSGYTIRMMESYSIQNHPIITELYRRHGKELNFVGVVIGVCSMEPVRRELAAMMVGNLVSETLKADGVVMTKALGGAPNIDLGAAASWCERFGVKTSLLIQILNTQASLDSEVLFRDPALNAIINTGVIFEKVNLPALERIIGGTKETPVFNDSIRQVAGQNLEVEQRFICGSLNQLGASCAKAFEY